MPKPTLSDFEIVLGPDIPSTPAEAFARSLVPVLTAERRSFAAANLRAAGIDPTDLAAVRKAYEDALFDACAGGGC